MPHWLECHNEECSAYKETQFIDHREHVDKWNKCSVCGKDTLMWWKTTGTAPAIRTGDGFVTDVRRGKLLSEENEVHRKSYQKDAMERTKKDWEALAAATHAKRGKKDDG